MALTCIQPAAALCILWCQRCPCLWRHIFALGTATKPCRGPSAQRSGGLRDSTCPEGRALGVSSTGNELGSGGHDADKDSPPTRWRNSSHSCDSQPPPSLAGLSICCVHLYRISGDALGCTAVQQPPSEKAIPTVLVARYFL